VCACVCAEVRVTVLVGTVVVGTVVVGTLQRNPVCLSGFLLTHPQPVPTCVTCDKFVPLFERDRLRLGR
jgi:hypothetical protein